MFLFEAIGRLVSRYIKFDVMVAAVFWGFCLLIPFMVEMVRNGNTQAGFSYIPIHNSLSDYPFYTSIIKQGLEGKNAVLNLFTTDRQSGNYLQLSYLLWGRIGRVLGLDDAHLVYFWVRFILGGIWAAVIYTFIGKFIMTARLRLIAYFMCLFSASWPRINPSGSHGIGWFMDWWSELDPTRRSAFLPHFLLGHIGLVSLLTVALSYSKNPRLYKLGIMTIIGWITGFVHPPSLVIAVIIIPVWAIISGKRRPAVEFIVSLSAAATSLFLVKYLGTLYPWDSISAYEGLSFAVSVPEYLLALGPVVPLGLAGFIISRKDKRMWLLFGWVTISLVMLYLIRFFPFSSLGWVRYLAFSNIRFLQVAVWVPLSVAAAVAIGEIFKFGYKTGLSVLLLFAVITFAGYPGSIKGQINYRYGDVRLNYPHRSYLDALTSLSEVTNEGDAVLSMPLAGQMVPSYNYRFTYIGNESHITPNLDRKLDRVWKFYSGKLPLCDAYKLLHDNRIKAVFFSFDEKKAGQAVDTYPFLLPWKRYGEIKIYRFINVSPQGC